LFRLLDDAHAGDVLLVEQIDRLSRLGTADWERLKAELAARKVRVVALDLPTSWTMATTGKVDNFTARMFEAINGMLMDMLAAIAQGLRRSPPPPDAGPRESQGGRQACRPAREREAECEDRRHAALRRVLQRRARGDRMQPGNRGKDREARSEGRVERRRWLRSPSRLPSTSR
jgi:hypothetical protein